MKTEYIQMKQSYKLSFQLYIFDENNRYTFQHTFYLGYGLEGWIKENKGYGLLFCDNKEENGEKPWYKLFLMYL